MHAQNKPHPAPTSIVALADRAFLSMMDGDSSGCDRALQTLCELRERDGDGALHRAIVEMNPRAIRVLASLAVIELHRLGFTLSDDDEATRDAA